MNRKMEKLLQNIQEETQYALEDAVLGQNLNRNLDATIRRTVTAVLYRNGIKRSQIQVEQQGNGFAVSVTLPPQGPIVQTVRLRFGENNLR